MLLALVLALCALVGFLAFVQTPPTGPSTARPAPAGSESETIRSAASAADGPIRESVRSSPSSPDSEVVPVDVEAELPPRLVAEIRQLALDNLESHLRAVREQLAGPNELDDLHALFEDAKRRVQLRKYELLLAKAERGEYQILRGQLPSSPEAIRGKLYYLMRGPYRAPDGTKLNVAVAVGPSEDRDLDELVRTSNDLALAAAEELAGRFNNLPLQERLRRVARFRELQAERPSGPEAARMRSDELTALGVHEWLELDTDGAQMLVREWLRRAAW